MPIEAAARIDAHWDFDDPRKSETAFRSLLEQAPEDRQHVLTQLARALALQRKYDEAHEILDQVARSLGDAPPLVRVRYLLERGRTLNSSGDAEQARPLFLEAWEGARQLGADFYAVDAAHMLAIVDPDDGAISWNVKGLELAVRSSDERARGWEGSLCNNLGWTRMDGEDYEAALGLFERALEAHRRHGRQRDIPVARWCVARCLRALGRAEEALEMQRALAAEHEAAGTSDPFVEEEIAACLRALGRADRPQ